MKYSIGDCLGESGFQFYEKLHAPIFLISKIGRVIKINKAGRKLLKIAQLTAFEIESNLKYHLNNPELTLIKSTILKTRNQRLHLTASYLSNSDYILIEIRR